MTYKIIFAMAITGAGRSLGHKNVWKYLASKECGLIFELGLPLRDQWQDNCRVRFSAGRMTLRVFLAIIFRVT
jgi:hypothetical protein